MKLRQVAKRGALEALAASKPGVRVGGVDPELAAARSEVARLSARAYAEHADTGSHTIARQRTEANRRSPADAD